VGRSGVQILGFDDFSILERQPNLLATLGGLDSIVNVLAERHQPQPPPFFFLGFIESS
jgi:hypothetical protein